MSDKPYIIRQLQMETGLTLNEHGSPGYMAAGDGDVYFINLDGQGLTQIPLTIVGLDCGLSLSDNLIVDVPANLGDSGYDVWLNNNRIESLPPECLNWESIPVWEEIHDKECVTLKGNPLKDPPSEIVAEGIEAIRSWFAAREKPRQRPRAHPARSQQKTPAETQAKSQQQTPIETAERPSEGRPPSSQTRQTKIFLCYRREDTQGFAGRIYDNLARKYGEEHIFRDIDSTPAGIRYSTWIESRVRQCSVMIVLIGSAWLSAKDPAGQLRLNLPKDWVRREIEAALSSNIPIIPVRVQGAAMPSEEDLPSSIADVSEFQSAEVTDSRWAYDVGLLIQAIDNLNASES